MAIPGSNIRTLRRQAGLSMTDFAKAVGIDLGNFSKLEAGKVGYSREAIERIAAALNVSVGTLFADPGVVEAAALRMRQAPILSAAELAAWHGPDDMEYSEDQQFCYVPLEAASRFLFTLVIEDEANAPMLQVGDQAIFDAKAELGTGMIVAAQDAHGAVAIGRFRPLPGTGFEVLPSADLARAVSTADTTELVVRGVLIETRRRQKLSKPY